MSITRGTLGCLCADTHNQYTVYFLRGRLKGSIRVLSQKSTTQAQLSAKNDMTALYSSLL